MTDPDPQADRFYTWERGAVEPLANRLSIEECRELAGEACSVWGARVPSIEQSDTEEGATYRLSRARAVITLHPDWQNEVTVLHEVAHHLCDTWKPWRRIGLPAGHGPEFVRTYLALVRWRWGVDLTKSAKAAGLEVGNRGPTVRMAPAVSTGLFAVAPAGMG